MDTIFSANLFLGSKAKDLGLIDEFGISSEVLAEKHPKVKIVNFSKQSQFEGLQQRFSMMLESNQALTLRGIAEMILKNKSK